MRSEKVEDLLEEALRLRRAKDAGAREDRLERKRAVLAWHMAWRDRAELVREMEAAVVETMTPG